MKIAVIGAGWAGLAAAVTATQAGHHTTVFEASRAIGGRARALFSTETVTAPPSPPRDTVEPASPGHRYRPLQGGRRSDTQCAEPGGEPILDNGQHILIGAYTETLRLMRVVGVDADQALLRLPLTLLFPDGLGLQLPSLRAPFDALAGILRARGWNWADKAALLRTAIGWQIAGFQCSPQQSVADLCRPLTARVNNELIEPLCVAALNTPADRSSGQVFLRVIQDSLFGAPGGSHLLLPRADLGSLFPQPAVQWLEQQGTTITLAHRVHAIAPQAQQWRVDGALFDRVLLACPPWDAARLVAGSGVPADTWLQHTQALQFEAIATVYARSRARLAQPMLSLRSDSTAPAQFVFDRGQLGGAGVEQPGLLAFVVSASHGDRQTLEDAVIRQGKSQLGLAYLQAVRTVIEKRATFACTPGLQRPAQQIAPGLLACGDYVEGPYPATLEGAVRSGVAAVQACHPQPA